MNIKLSKTKQVKISLLPGQFELKKPVQLNRLLSNYLTVMVKQLLLLHLK